MGFMSSTLSWDIFDHQHAEYQDSVLPPDVKPRVAVARELLGRS